MNYTGNHSYKVSNTKRYKKKYNNIIRMLRKDKLLYLMAIPGIIYFILFHYVPMYGISIAFTDYSIYKPMSEASFIGLENFNKLFGTFGFNRALRNTIIISIYNLLFSFPAPIILALILNEVWNKTFKRTVQTVIYLPHFISWIVILGIFSAIFSSSTGVIKRLAEMVGYSGKVQNIMNLQSTFRAFLVGTNIWKTAGFGTILYMATLASINPELYEAAIVDGATRWQQTWHITLPGLRSTIVILLIMRAGRILNANFEQIYALYNPFVYEVSEVLETYIYKMGIGEAKFSFSTAAGVFKAIIGFILVVVTNWLAKKIDSDYGIY